MSSSHHEQPPADDQSTASTAADEPQAPSPVAGDPEAASVRATDGGPELPTAPASDDAGEPPEPGYPASRKAPRSAAEMWDEDDDDHLPAPKGAQYTAPGPKPPQRRSEGTPGGQLQRGETIAFMLLAGIALGALAGWGIDKLIGTFPAFMIVGVFAGFGLALYAVFIETR